MIADQCVDAAEQLFQQALAAQGAGAFDDAERLYRRSIDADASRSAPQHNLGVLLRGLGRLDEARELLSGLLAREPDLTTSRYALGLVLLGMGDYQAAWPLFEQRRHVPALKIQVPVLPFPEWKGEPVAGKRIVLFPEQGLGDNIQFARFAPVLWALGAEVLMLCRPPLHELLTDALGGVEVQPAQGSVNLGEPDYWALFGSLPGWLGTTLDALPPMPRLGPAGERRRAPGDPFRIGLATRGNPAHHNDGRRSLGEAQAARLRKLPGEIVSLHPEDSGAQNFAQTAVIIAGLDLVVTVDTSVAHLAGAMGKPVFILLPGFATDWRWGLEREDSPWYPSARLFRGSIDGDWSDALGRIETAVHELTKGSPPPT